MLIIGGEINNSRKRDKVFQKVSPSKWIMRFCKNEKFKCRKFWSIWSFGTSGSCSLLTSTSTTTVLNSRRFSCADVKKIWTWPLPYTGIEIFGITGRYIIYRTTYSKHGSKRAHIKYKENRVSKSNVESPFTRASYIGAWRGDARILSSYLQRLWYDRKFRGQIFIRVEDVMTRKKKRNFIKSQKY